MCAGNPSAEIPQREKRDSGHEARVPLLNNPFCECILYAWRIEKLQRWPHRTICRRRLRKRKLNSRFQLVANETSGKRATNFAYRKTIFRHGHFSYAFNILYYSVLCAYVCNAAKIALLNYHGFGWIFTGHLLPSRLLFVIFFINEACNRYTII